MRAEEEEKGRTAVSGWTRKDGLVSVERERRVRDADRHLERTKEGREKGRKVGRG